MRRFFPVRLERLILSSGDQTVTVRFHKRLTVVAGVGPLEREGVTSEVIGALTGPRPGTNLEVAMDDGSHVAVLRPAWGLGDRVLDLESGTDATGRFRTIEGRVDLLAHTGLSPAAVRRLVRVGPFDVLAPEEERRLIDSFAGLPQAELWATAERLGDSRARLTSLAGYVADPSRGDPAHEEVEERHREHERAQDRMEYIRHHGIFTAVACAVGGIPAAVMDRWAAAPFAAVALAFMVVSMVFRRKLEVARAAEDEALHAAGATSYGGFLHQRVAVLLGTEEQHRRDVSEAVAEHRRAQAAWIRMVGPIGDVDAEWALARQPVIAAAAAECGDDHAASLVRTLRGAHPASARDLGELILHRAEDLERAAEKLPLILDEPFEGMDPSGMRWMLEVLLRISGSPQVILLTASREVLAWAEEEALAGNLSVVSPTPAAARAMG